MVYFYSLREQSKGKWGIIDLWGKMKLINQKLRMRRSIQVDNNEVFILKMDVLNLFIYYEWIRRSRSFIGFGL